MLEDDTLLIERPHGGTAFFPASDTQQVLSMMLVALADGLDHPELWSAFPEFMRMLPDLSLAASLRSLHAAGPMEAALLSLILTMCRAAGGEAHGAMLDLEELASGHSQSPLFQGGLFHLKSLLDPENPKYQLRGKICPTPFLQLDVLEGGAHLCCASWLNTSVGDLATTPWQQVWNSPAAQAIRASLFEGSYRYCNKIACPVIQGDNLAQRSELAAQHSPLGQAVREGLTELPQGPEAVNLAYDRTCNLSCPSCRTTAYAADAETRTRLEVLQRDNILPLLHSARTVFITGSGDPFASKNFRRLMEQLGADDYPDLRFQIMTNGMLFTRSEWARFPALHRRVKSLKVSIDAACGPTHEMLRRGAHWERMLENMEFAGELLAQGLIDHYQLVFTVQTDNYAEMGEACDLARKVGADGIYFARITNWGTFSTEEYRRKAIFLTSHPEHASFLEAMRDPRLLDPIVILGDLHAFVPATRSLRRFDYALG